MNEFKIKYSEVIKDILTLKVSLRKIKLMVKLANIYVKYFRYEPIEHLFDKDLIKEIKNLKLKDYIAILNMCNKYCEPKLKDIKITDVGAFMNKLRELCK